VGLNKCLHQGPTAVSVALLAKHLDITHLDSQTISEGCTERHCNSDEFPHNFFFKSFRKANIVSLDDA